MLHQNLAAFEIDARDGPDGCTVCLQGELDLAGCPILEQALVEADRSHADRILVDLEELTFVDACGLDVLRRAADRSASNGNRLRVTRGAGQVARVFRLTGLDTTLPFAP